MCVRRPSLIENLDQPITHVKVQLHFQNLTRERPLFPEFNSAVRTSSFAIINSPVKPALRRRPSFQQFRREA